MKKTLSVVIGSAFLIGFAATSAFATHGDIPSETSVVVGSNAKITMDGSLRFRGYTQKDTVKDSASKVAYDGRVRLGVKAALSDAASGYLQLETGDGSGDGYVWGNGTSSGLHSGGSKQGVASSSSTTCTDNNADGDVTDAGECVTSTSSSSSTDLSILQAWINYKPGKFGVKVGHMPLMLGNKVFFDHTGSGDDAIQAYMATDSTVVALLTIKFEEGSQTASGDDIDGYVALFTQKLANDMHVGSNLTWLHMTDDMLDMYNLGVDFSGKFGPAKIKADIEYQFGDDGGALGQGSQANQASFAGYAALVDASMAAGAANVGLVLGYGTGDDSTTDTDQGQFINFLTDTRYQSTIVGYRFATPTLGTAGANTTKNTGLSNIFLVQANVNTKTTCPITKKDLSLKARVNYMTLNEVPTGWQDDLGVELEAFATWKLSNGLSYGIEAAYLVAGDAWKMGGTADGDDAYFVRQRLELKF